MRKTSTRYSDDTVSWAERQLWQVAVEWIVVGGVCQMRDDSPHLWVCQQAARVLLRARPRQLAELGFRCGLDGFVWNAETRKMRVEWADGTGLVIPLSAKLAGAGTAASLVGFEPDGNENYKVRQNSMVIALPPQYPVTGRTAKKQQDGE